MPNNYQLSQLLPLKQFSLSYSRRKAWRMEIQK